MVRRASKAKREDHIERPRLGARDIISIRETLEDLGVARCPLCRDILVARMGRSGPGFFCRCRKKRAA